MPTHADELTSLSKSFVDFPYANSRRTYDVDFWFLKSKACKHVSQISVACYWPSNDL